MTSTAASAPAAGPSAAAEVTAAPPPDPGPADQARRQEVARLARSLSFVAEHAGADGPGSVFRLRVADPGHRSALDRERWSASGMQAFSSCPARWATEKLLPGWVDPFSAAELGSSAHKALEVLFGMPAAARTPLAAVAIVASLEADFPGTVCAPVDPVAMFRWRADVMDRVYPLWRIEDPRSVIVIGRELHLDGVRVGGVPFSGFIDRVDLATTVAGATGRRVVDYKSGADRTPTARTARYGDKHGDQLRLYALALQAFDGCLPVEAAVYYVQHGTCHVASLKQGDLDRVQTEFTATYERMRACARGGLYPTSASPLCGWCPLATVCPTAAAAGRATAKVESAALGTTLGVRVQPAPLEPASPAPTSTVCLPAPAPQDPAVPQQVPLTGGASPGGRDGLAAGFDPGVF